MNKEIFKEIKGFEKRYLISNIGNVFSIRRKKILIPKIDKYGYKVVCLYNGKRHYKTIHRLVAEAFITKNNKEDIVVNHIDSNKLNNDVSNLEWTTISGNTKHCYENNEKFREQVLQNAKKGTEKKRNKVKIDGIEFNSQIEASRYFNVNKKTIYNWLHKGGDVNEKHHKCEFI